MSNFFGKLFGRDSKSDDMSNGNSNMDFIDRAFEGLQLQTDAHRQTWKLGEEKNWAVDMTQGTLTFTFENGKIVQTDIQIIGTYNSQDSTFMWGWDHPSVPENLAQHALLAKKWGEENGENDYVTLKIESSVDEAWRMSALTNRVAEANGVYRGDANGTFVFMTMGTLSIHQE